MTIFNAHHENLRGLLSSLNTAKKADEGNYEYKIYFKNGITYRDDAVLRFVNYSEKGKSDFERINQRFKGIISSDEVNETIQKLKLIGCLKLNGNEVEVTETGKNIV